MGFSVPDEATETTENKGITINLPARLRSPWFVVMAVLMGSGSVTGITQGKAIVGWFADDAIRTQVDSAKTDIMREVIARDEMSREAVREEMANFVELMSDAFPQVAKSAENMEQRKRAGESIRRAIQAKRDNARTLD